MLVLANNCKLRTNWRGVPLQETYTFQWGYRVAWEEGHTLPIRDMSSLIAIHRAPDANSLGDPWHVILEKEGCLPPISPPTQCGDGLHDAGEGSFHLAKDDVSLMFEVSEVVDLCFKIKQMEHMQHPMLDICSQLLQRRQELVLNAQAMLIPDVVIPLGPKHMDDPLAGNDSLLNHQPFKFRQDVQFLQSCYLILWLVFQFSSV